MDGSYYPLAFFKDYTEIAGIKNISEYRRLIFKPLMYSWKAEIETSEEEVKAALSRDYIPDAYKLAVYPQPEALEDFKKFVNDCLKIKRRHNAAELETMIADLSAKIRKNAEELNSFKGLKAKIYRFGSFCRLKKEHKQLLKKGACAGDWLNWGYCRFGPQALSLD